MFQKIECPFAARWEIEEEKLMASKKSNDELFVSEWFEASNIPSVKYRLKISPSKHRDFERNKAWLYLEVQIGNETKILADFKFSIESAGWSYKDSYEFVKNWNLRSVQCCDASQLFESQFIINGKLTVKCEGILSVERKLKCVDDSDSEDDKWKMEGFLENIRNGDGTDFTIVVDGKCIQVSFIYILCHYIEHLL